MRSQALGTILALLSALAAPAASQECTCTEIEQLFDFQTANPDDAPWMEDELWEFKYCSGGTIYIGFVMGDHPGLDTYTLDEDGNDKFLIDGVWVRYDALPQILTERCIDPLS